MEGMRRWLALALFAPLFGSPGQDYLSAKRKFDMIESGRAQAGSRITLTPAELNAYVTTETAAYASQGFRRPRLELGNGTATGFALIDFVKLRKAAGKPPNWMMTKLLAGEREVKVSARVTSGSGKAAVHPQSVEISGFTIDGAALDFLIRHYLYAQFPDAKVGEPFELSHGVERLEVKPAGVGVILKK
jgi:hypothetical protein